MSPVRFAVASFAAVAIAVFGAPGAVGAQTEMSGYVALGDSLTAGFVDGSLHRRGQLGGYASLLAGQVGIGSRFELPQMSDPGIPAALRIEEESGSSVAPRPGMGSPVNLTLPRPYDNLSVPGAKVGDALRASTDAGGLRDLVLRGLGTQLEQALLLEPTFVSLWLGSSDVLGAAISGIVLDGMTLTPLDGFARDYRAIVQALVDSGVEGGVVATVPRIKDLPFVSALPTTAVDARGLPLAFNGRPVPLLGHEGSLRRDDFVLLSAMPLLARGDGVARALGGSGRPLPDEVVLSRLEARQVDERILAYNRVIRSSAAQAGFAVVDVAVLFEAWRREGVVVGRESFGTDFPHGGLFSLDGVHPSLLGQALLANAFIDAIGEATDARIARIGEAALGELGRRAVRAARTRGSEAVPVFSARALENLRFALGIPRSAKLLDLKRRALERLRPVGPTPDLPDAAVHAALVGSRGASRRAAG